MQALVVILIAAVAGLAAAIALGGPARPPPLASINSPFAGSEFGNRFDSYLLLAPFLGQDAPTQRPSWERA